MRAEEPGRGLARRPVRAVAPIERSPERLLVLGLRDPEITELDINPLLAHPKGSGATVADCRMILKSDDTQGAA